MDQELPLIVWLRGDEDYCADFVLDADAVMSQLQIRRSRLTQISGKELRVGRIRRGRYISPVYRQVDVDSYAVWTRASASQVKSAHVVHEATAGLIEHSERLADYLQSVPEQLASELRQDLERASLQLTRTIHQQNDLRSAADDYAREFALASERRLKSVMNQQAETISQLLGHVQTQASQIQVLAQQARELAALARVQRQEFTDQAERQDDAFAAFLAELQQIRQTIEKPAKQRPVSKAGIRRLSRVKPGETLASPATPVRPPRPRTLIGAQSSKPRSVSRRIKAPIDSSIDKSLVSSTSASEACLSGAVSRP